VWRGWQETRGVSGPARTCGTQHSALSRSAFETGTRALLNCVWLGASAECFRSSFFHPLHLLTCPLMDYLWTPWRYAYVSSTEKSAGCVFCEAQNEKDDAKALIVHRGKHCFIILNAYPYTPGHVMIVPYAHLDELRKLSAEAAQEMMALSQRMETVLRELYRPDGINLGMNIGKAAGAGIAGHIHMHVLPRWVADANFMSVVGETRILPETLDVTWGRMRETITKQRW
jgi:ATP adenylyltransferase